MRIHIYIYIYGYQRDIYLYHMYMHMQVYMCLPEAQGRSPGAVAGLQPPALSVPQVGGGQATFGGGIG